MLTNKDISIFNPTKQHVGLKNVCLVNHKKHPKKAMISYVDYMQSSSKNENRYTGYSFRSYHYKRTIDENFHFKGGLNELSLNATSYHKIGKTGISFFAGGGIGAMMINPNVHGPLESEGGFSENIYGSGEFYQFGGVGGSIHTGFAYKTKVATLKKGSNISFQVHTMLQLNANITAKLKTYDGQGNILFNQRYMSVGWGWVSGISFSYNF